MYNITNSSNKNFGFIQNKENISCIPIRPENCNRDAKTLFKLGLILLREREISEAINFFRDAAVKGDLKATRYFMLLISHRKAGKEEISFWADVILAAEKRPYGYK
jgi:hypothetical protein